MTSLLRNMLLGAAGLAAASLPAHAQRSENPGGVGYRAENPGGVGYRKNENPGGVGFRNENAGGVGYRNENPGGVGYKKAAKKTTKKNMK
jgi:hypothetical protein